MSVVHPYAYSRSRRILWAVAVLLLWPGAQAPAAERPLPDLKAGRSAYDQHCARCHGDAAKGDGVDAKRFYPRPRDLTMGIYKFRTTASGTPPSDEDLFRTVTAGLPGTNMPDWQHLDEAARWQLVYYLKSLSPVFEQTTPAPIEAPPDPGPKRTDRARGKAVYEEMGCAACHGPQGRANGPSAPGLVDDWGMPLRPTNLTQGWAYRGGSDPQSIMMRLLAGIDGAGMPSYVGAVSPEDAWQLAYYVASLQEPPHWNMIARARYAPGPLPETLDDTRWADAEQTTLRLRNVVTPEGEWANPPTIRAVTLQVLHNDEAAAFRLSWDDPTEDHVTVSALEPAIHDTPPDRLALVLKPPDAQGDVITLQAWPYTGAPALNICHWAAGAKAVERLATDLEQVITATGVALKSFSVYEDGRWTLLLQRPLQPAEPVGAAAMTLDQFTSVAVAVWDGGNGTARAVSPWVDIVLRKQSRQHQQH